MRTAIVLGVLLLLSIGLNVLMPTLTPSVVVPATSTFVPNPGLDEFYLGGPPKPEVFPDPGEMKYWRYDREEELDPEANCGTYIDWTCERRMSGRI